VVGPQPALECPQQRHRQLGQLGFADQRRDEQFEVLPALIQGRAFQAAFSLDCSHNWPASAIVALLLTGVWIPSRISFMAFA